MSTTAASGLSVPDSPPATKAPLSEKPSSPAATVAKSPAPVAAASPTAERSSAPAPPSEEEKKATKTEAANEVEEAEEEEEEEEEPLPEDPDGIINMEIFSQIQDMDDDDDDDGEGGGHEFSKSIVWGYFEQAENTFKQMEEAINEPSLSKLSSLGHFLKGSSAALGIINVQNSCEKMQHYGNLRDEEIGGPLTEEEALKRITQLLVDCKRDYAMASRWLKRLYSEED